jgi:putative inorganic carbon (hco3(-)) transporter
LLMPLTSLLFLVIYFAACVGAVFRPTIGVVAYMLAYMICPEHQWWGEETTALGLRYSYTLVLATALGMILHYRKLRFGNGLMLSQEWRLVAFAALLWLVAAFLPPLGENLDPLDYAPLKITKVVIFALILTHVATNITSLNWVLWCFVAAAAFQGYEALMARDWMFREGRLEYIGGVDFMESNGVAVFFAACLPLIGIQLIRSGTLARLFCLIAGVLSVNSIILTRSRGGFVAIGGTAIAAVVLAPRRYRKPLAIGLVVAAIGAYVLTDAAFWQRMDTIAADEENRDYAAQSRVDVWRATLAMVQDYPLGVGPNNFLPSIGPYNDGITRDSHNLWVRCLGELGIPGTLAMALVVIGAVLVLIKVRREAGVLSTANRDNVTLIAYALTLSLGAFLLGGLTWSNTYVEALWWFLTLPVCLLRCLHNLRNEKEAAQLLMYPVRPEELSPGKTPASD